MSKEYYVKVLKDIGAFKKGLIVKVNDNDRVWGHYWRRRLKDAERDGCCEKVVAKATSKSINKGTDKQQSSLPKSADKES